MDQDPSTQRPLGTGHSSPNGENPPMSEILVHWVPGHPFPQPVRIRPTQFPIGSNHPTELLAMTIRLHDG